MTQRAGDGKLYWFHKAKYHQTEPLPLLLLLVSGQLRISNVEIDGFIRSIHRVDTAGIADHQLED